MSVTCSCGHDNSNQNIFCEGCGSRLGASCAACGNVGAPGALFCGRCGAAIAQSVAPAASVGPPPSAPPASHQLEGEGKQLTVLFADIQGSMELQEELDVEAWAGIVDRFVKILVDEVRRFGGTVDKFTGDGIMALFGTPRPWGTTLIGPATRRGSPPGRGRALGEESPMTCAGSVGAHLAVEYTAGGSMVGLAQRMESLAEPGAVRLTASGTEITGAGEGRSTRPKWSNCTQGRWPWAWW